MTNSFYPSSSGDGSAVDDNGANVSLIRFQSMELNNILTRLQPQTYKQSYSESYSETTATD